MSSIYDDNTTIIPPVTVDDGDAVTVLKLALQLRERVKVLETAQAGGDVSAHNEDAEAHADIRQMLADLEEALENYTPGGGGDGGDADTLEGRSADYFLAAATYTAADVLSKLLTLHGPGSGLDADLLDGNHASDFLPAATYTAANVLAKLLTVHGSGSGLDADLLDGNHASDFLSAATYTAANVLAKLLTVHGSGSGLDADLLDGKHSADFVSLTNALNTIGAFAKAGGTLTGDVTITNATASARSVLNILSNADTLPAELKLGQSAPKWSVNCRGSGDSYYFSLYSYVLANYVMKAFGDGAVHFYGDIYAKFPSGAKRVFHAGNITAGTSVPSAGLGEDGDIYIQYIP